MASEGPKTSCALILARKQKFNSLHVSTHGDRCPSVSVVSGIPGEPREGAAQATRSEFCFGFSLDSIPSNAVQECVANVLKICSFPGLPISLLRLKREVRSGICADNIVSC